MTGSLAEELEALRLQLSRLEAENARLLKLLESSLNRPSIWRRWVTRLGGGRSLPDAASATELKPEEVNSVRFGATRFRVGYDQDEVDIFLDRVERHLREQPERWSASDRLGADSVMEQKFTDRRFRAGYRQKEVDRFLDRIVNELRRER